MSGMVARNTLAITAFAFCLAAFLQFGGGLGYSTLEAHQVKALGGDFPSFWAHLPLLDLPFGLLRPLPEGCYEALTEPFVVTGNAICMFK